MVLVVNFLLKLLFFALLLLCHDLSVHDVEAIHDLY